jgi:hypothetical protein
MKIEIWMKYSLWDFNGHGTSMATLMNVHPGLMRHVARVDEENNAMKSVELVVECADGTVNACITVQLEYSDRYQMKYISKILVKIVAAHGEVC